LFASHRRNAAEQVSELGVPLPAAPAAAAALPELPACRPPAGADPPPAAAQRTLSPACARAHRVERERGRRNNHTGRHDCATARVNPPRSTSRPRRSRRGVGTPCSDSVPCQMEERLMWLKVLEGPECSLAARSFWFDFGLGRPGSKVVYPPRLPGS
jgi:hypothetical protein